MSRALSLAGFQVTLSGRFWVTPEADKLQLINRHVSALQQSDGLLDGSIRGATGGDSIKVAQGCCTLRRASR